MAATGATAAAAAGDAAAGDAGGDLMTAADVGGDLYNTAARAVGILQVKMLVMMIPEWVGWVFYPGYILFLSHFLFFK